MGCGAPLSRNASPAISVVVPAYGARDVIDGAIVSLLTQDLQEPYEVIVVDSGTDGCAAHVEARYPELRVVRFGERLLVGGACNAGLRIAEAEYVAFLPADCKASPEWLRLRLAKHREGYAVVGGAVANGTPRNVVGSAGYYLEYSSVMPSARILAEQETPHSLSYKRELFDRLGEFPEDTGAGEDTVFNRRCVEAGLAVGFDPAALIEHRNPTRLGAYLKHQYEHGRALAHCAEQYASWSPSHPLEQPLVLAVARIAALYPARRWLSALSHVARGRPQALPGFLALSPLVWLGAGAASAGVLAEFRTLRSAHASAGLKGEPSRSRAPGTP